MQANPHGEIELGARRLKVIAQRVTEEERALLWPRLVAMYPPYESYQERTTRRIPVMRLLPEA